MPKAGEKERRNPADWKHLGDCREHSHIIQCWLRFDSALWSDSFDLSQRACVQLPGSALAGKKDRARRSRLWMVPLLLMETLLTANISFGLKCNQLVDGFGTKGRDPTTAFQNIWGTLLKYVPQRVDFSLICCSVYVFSSLLRRESKDVVWSRCVDSTVPTTQ